ncbi:MAG TPA: LLM class flavin-dependent oxidoreductase [Gemmatimonadales bacterium]|nr:LLM class flavin-dependent oxidoreductase [Gemmatimonadales bacterium]
MDYGKLVQFGVFILPDSMQPARPLELAVLADELGFDLVGIQDHPYQRRFYDTWTLLTAIAMRTKQITVFPDVANIQLRPPAILAKSAATLDLLSNGRVQLGLGAGSASMTAAIKGIGGPGHAAGESVSALEEAIQVIRLMWSGERSASFDGKFYQLAGVHPGPAPAHPIGIWLGAYRPRMISLVGRVADGWVPSFGYLQPSDLDELNKRIDDEARNAGRDPLAIRRVLNVGEQTAELLVGLTIDHGMDTYIVSGEDPEAMRRFATEVAPAVREGVAKAR